MARNASSARHVYGQAVLAQALQLRPQSDEQGCGFWIARVEFKIISGGAWMGVDIEIEVHVAAKMLCGLAFFTRLSSH